MLISIRRCLGLFQDIVNLVQGIFHPFPQLFPPFRRYRSAKLLANVIGDIY